MKILSSEHLETKLYIQTMYEYKKNITSLLCGNMQ